MLSATWAKYKFFSLHPALLPSVPASGEAVLLSDWSSREWSWGDLSWRFSSAASYQGGLGLAASPLLAQAAASVETLRASI